jgi:VWFA-related protein
MGVRGGGEVRRPSGVRVVAVLALLALVLPGTLAQQRSDLEEDVEVGRVIVDVRVLTLEGDPVQDLGPEDFVVKIKGEEMPVEAAEWVDGSAISLEGLTDEQIEALGAAPGHHGGRLIVMFFQRDLFPTRIVGLMRMLDETREFVQTLQPDDMIAIVVYDSHLVLYQDFTTDHDLIHEILLDRIVPYVKPDRPEPGPFPSLAAHFDHDEAKDAATPEEALLVTAAALEPIPGSKEMLFIGWGMGVMGGGTVQIRPEYGPARRALLDARVTVFSMDFTRADYHSLQGPLIKLARDTGGFYIKTFINANVAMDAVARAIRGHYVLTFVKPDLRPGRHVLKVKLRDKKGVVYYQEYYDSRDDRDDRDYRQVETLDAEL